MKNVLTIPRLRHQLNNFDARGCTHNELMRQLEEIYKYGKTGLIYKTILPLIREDSKSEFRDSQYSQSSVGF